MIRLWRWLTAWPETVQTPGERADLLASIKFPCC